MSLIKVNESSANVPVPKGTINLVLYVLVGMVIVAGGIFIYERIMGPAANRALESAQQVSEEVSAARERNLEAEAEEYLLSDSVSKSLLETEWDGVTDIQLSRVPEEVAYEYLLSGEDRMREQGILKKDYMDQYESAKRSLFTDQYHDVVFFEATIYFSNGNTNTRCWYAWRSQGRWHHRLEDIIE